MSGNAKIQQLQYKILHGTHLTKHKLYIMGLKPVSNV